MEEIYNRIIKYQWFCLIVLIIFHFESIYEKQLFKDFFEHIFKENLYPTVINRVLTGIIILSFVYITYKLSKVLNEQGEIISSSYLEYLIDKTVFLWCLLAKYAFVIICSTICNIPFYDAVLTGWHKVYFILIGISIFFLIKCFKRKRM